MTEYQALFAQEAGELFANAYERLLVAEEKDALDKYDVAELFRAIHTIKGGGGSVDFDHLSRYAHKIENLLAQLRDDKIAYQRGMAGFLLDNVDRLQEVLDLEAKAEIDENDFNQKIALLEKKIAEFAGENADQTSVQTSISAPAANDGFMLFTPEMIEDFNRAEKGADDGFMLFTPEMIAEAQKTPEKPAEKPLEKPAEKSVENRAELPRNENVDPKKELQTGAIKVDLEKIDRLLNRVGELVITNSTLHKFAETLSDRESRGELEERLAQLTRHIRELQDAVMAVRMVPLDHIYAKLPKMVRDLSKKLDKKARFISVGGSVEIDKVMIEGLIDPLNHIIRNAIDHGVESEDAREKSGKDLTATIKIEAAQENGQIVINISDDGRGINAAKVVKKAIEKGIITAEIAAKMSEDEKNDLIFAAGLTTAQKVTDISGRGVGMDVVRSNIAKLGGFARVRSREGAGTTISIALPLTLAILDGLAVSVGDREFILPLALVAESLQPKDSMIQTNGDGSRMYLMLRNEIIPIVELHALFGIKPRHTRISRGMIIVARSGSEKIALFVDSFGAQRQVVVKSLEKNFRRAMGVGGATVQGDGAIVLILDPIGLAEKERESRSKAALSANLTAQITPRAAAKRPQSKEAEEYLIFRMFGLPYGALLKRVSKIVTYQSQITPLPFSPPWILGVINLRGEVTPIIDFRLKFSKLGVVYDEETIIIALKFPNDRLMAIAVDSIETIALLKSSDMCRPIDIGGGLEARYLEGLAQIDGEMVSIINIDEMLNLEEL
ncbi:MAG: chemotaxis protein CheW [Helicobacteraceae bacterium]|nr:chemotaxis protein CheW [Helicobacteraceae bacterium]